MWMSESMNTEYDQFNPQVIEQQILHRMADTAITFFRAKQNITSIRSDRLYTIQDDPGNQCLNLCP